MSFSGQIANAEAVQFIEAEAGAWRQHDVKIGSRIFTKALRTALISAAVVSGVTLLGGFALLPAAQTVLFGGLYFSYTGERASEVVKAKKSANNVAHINAMRNGLPNSKVKAVNKMDVFTKTFLNPFA